MSDSKIILPDNLRKLMPRNENQLQSMMFIELERKGLLRCKKIGVAVSITRDQQVLGRVIYLEEADAKMLCDAMNDYFSANNMTNWLAVGVTCELF